MSVWSKIKGTLEGIWQFGLGGPQIKANGAALETANAANDAFAVMRGSSPAGNDDFVTLEYFNSNNAAAKGLTYVKIPIATSTVVSSDALPDNAEVRDAFVVVGTPYDNAATIALKRTGDVTKAPMVAGDSDLATAGFYHVPQMLNWGDTGAGTVTCTIANAPTAGACAVYLGYVTPEDIT